MMVGGVKKENVSVTFGNDERYFDENSPWSKTIQNLDKLKGVIAVRLLAADSTPWADTSRRFGAFIAKQGVDATVIEGARDCGHQLQCMLPKFGPVIIPFFHRSMGGTAAP
jgi:hypothetical protein